MQDKKIPSFKEEYIRSVLEDISDVPDQTANSMGATAFDALIKTSLEDGTIIEY